MLAAAAAVNALDTSDDVRARLRLAVCGAAEMAGFLSRWDRYYPKAFEAMANHRYAALGFSCETNLLAELGRGTIRRRFASSVAEARWARRELKISSHARVQSAASRRQRVTAGALLARGSSERQLAADRSLDLVLTDPPYFDDVQYAELASLFLAWARSVKLVPANVSLDLHSEAVANAARGVGVREYQAILTRIFTETRRTLKLDGRLVISFHNTDLRAWWALARALHLSGFAVVALAAAQTENSNDHSKRNHRSFTKDLVLECRSRPVTSRLSIFGCVDDSQDRELSAAGRAVADGGGLDLPAFRRLFLQERSTLRRPRIEVTGDDP
jgi:adenine-specific DNA methylase